LNKDLILAVSWTLLIIILSSLPGSSMPKVSLIPNMDKIGHFSVYAVSSYLWVRYFVASMPVNQSIRFSLILTAAIGILMEIAQFLFFRGRMFEVYDIIANIGGSIVGVLVFIKLKKY